MTAGTVAVAFVSLILGWVLAWLRSTARDTQASDARVKKAEEAARAAAAELAAAEAQAAKTHESVDARLGRLEEEAQANAKRDSVDVANEIIKG